MVVAAVIISWSMFPTIAMFARVNFVTADPSAVPWAVAACILGIPAIMHLAGMLHRKACRATTRGRLSLERETAPPTKIDE